MADEIAETQTFESYDVCVMNMQGKVENAEEYCKKIFDKLPPKAEDNVAEQKNDDKDEDDKEKEKEEVKSNPLDFVQLNGLKFYNPPTNKADHEEPDEDNEGGPSDDDEDNKEKKSDDKDEDDKDKEKEEKKATDLCTTCGGSGQVDGNDCSMCQGTGHVQTEEPKKKPEDKAVEGKEKDKYPENPQEPQTGGRPNRFRPPLHPEDKDMRQETRTDKPGFGYPAHARQNEEDWKSGPLGNIAMGGHK